MTWLVELKFIPIAVDWERTQEAGSITSLNSHGDPLTELMASLLVP